jgi:beta-aspartyl-peptidase (threonine type)
MNARPKRWALAVHGGAGVNRGEALLDTDTRGIRDGLAAALDAGGRVLARGGSSLDAVELAVRVLEDSPLFNAGRGAVFNADGDIELEASIMRGRTLEAGAVAGLRRIRNPVSVARKVMEQSPHVFLHGANAESFAIAQGLESVDPTWFHTAHRRQALEAARRGSPPRPKSVTPGEQGTVGAVALDCTGEVAAATSTGGLTNKWAGRIGDSPLIGAGCYASNTACAVSCTGQGEYFIRATVARDIAALIEFAGYSPEAAAERIVHARLGSLGGQGGAVVIDTAGTVAFAFNTEVMLRGSTDDSGAAFVAVFRDDAQPRG